ncbi:MAG: radical SAM protein [Desulfobacterales bacterium]|nr:MAG: radical SAM protein [Desulfobacterales bacterium]
MARCSLCRRNAPDISLALRVCLPCIRRSPKDALAAAARAHRRSRAAFALPAKPPRDPQGASCHICVNRCQIPENSLGYCGLRSNRGGRLIGVSATEGKLSWYHDPLPTNCVAHWVCPGGTGAGYPKYAHRLGAETGYKNLAVFFHGCSFNCLFCQNWHFRNETLNPRTRTIHDLVADVDRRTSCICYFGGDPSPQLPFSLKAARQALSTNKDRILRICWETNGAMHPDLLDQMMELAVLSGGCIKFDLKAWDSNLHIALTGLSNERTLANFKRAAANIARRPVPPPLIANTLMVPGYIDENEVRGLTHFIAAIDPQIPYSLLAFHPQFFMSDLPLTPKSTADRFLHIARDAGLTNVRIGNIHLLG